MKIVHLCLCGPVTDGWTYQENLLTKYHKKIGFDVTIIASCWKWGNDGKLTTSEQTNYINEDGVQMLRLPIKKGTIQSKLKRYVGLKEALEQEHPDILFIHGCQFLDMETVIRYLKKHRNVKAYLDNHADLSNSATNPLSRKVLHGILWRHYAQKANPYIEKFYGVLPARVDFLTQVYGLPEQKVELLIMGADDELVQKYNSPEKRRNTRAQYGIAGEQFLIVSGGKIDSAKRQTLLLMKAVRNMNNSAVKLIVFGSVSEDIKAEMLELVDGQTVLYAGWKTQEESYQMFAAADLVAFPGRHSVFWEQVAGQGIPMLVKDWAGTHHVDVGGNVAFLYNDSVEEIQTWLEWLLAHPEKYQEMKKIAAGVGKKHFSYGNIARRSIEAAP